MYFCLFSNVGSSLGYTSPSDTTSSEYWIWKDDVASSEAMSQYSLDELKETTKHYRSLDSKRLSPDYKSRGITVAADVGAHPWESGFLRLKNL